LRISQNVNALCALALDTIIVSVAELERVSPKPVRKLDLLLDLGVAAPHKKSAHGRRSYFDLVREMRDASNHRLRFVRQAR
jgi:hypothetical protein